MVCMMDYWVRLFANTGSQNQNTKQGMGWEQSQNSYLSMIKISTYKHSEYYQSSVCEIVNISKDHLQSVKDFSYL